MEQHDTPTDEVDLSSVNTDTKDQEHAGNDFATLFPQFHPITLQFLHGLETFWPRPGFKEQLSSRMERIKGLPVGVIKRLISEDMFGTVANEINTAVELDAETPVLSLRVLSMILSVLGFEREDLARQTDEAIEKNKNEPKYFMGFEETVHYELFDNETLEWRDGVFLSLDKSRAIRLMARLEELVEEVGIESSPITKYYALITIANVGEALNFLDKDTHGQTADDVEGAERDAPGLLAELLYLDVPTHLLSYMMEIYEGLTEDEIEMLTEQEDSPPNYPRSRTFSRKVEHFLESFVHQRIGDMVIYAFDDGSRIQNFDALLRGINGVIQDQVRQHNCRIRDMQRGNGLDKDDIDRRLMAGVGLIEKLLYLKLTSQFTKRSHWDSRRNAVLFLIADSQNLLTRRKSKPQCAFVWNRDIDVMLTDAMHSILSGIGKLEVMRESCRRDASLKDALAGFNAEQHLHFPDMGGVMRLYSQIMND